MGGLPFNHGGGGYMGPVYNPFQIDRDPNEQNFSVQDVSPPPGVDVIRMDRRRLLRDALDDWQRNKETASKATQAMDEFYARAYNLVSSPLAKKAFSLKDEPDKLRDEYGRHYFGQSCLLARRLVEAGVRCVTINLGGWDTHTDNFNALKNDLLPHVDSGYSTLLKDLQQRGMLDTTLVVWMGEFGRTPHVNAAAGRDHWPGITPVCMGGGGVKTGMVVGSSNASAEYPKDRPIRVEDVAATLYKTMGINYEKEYMSPQQRPIKINYDGTPISELL
jgi:arylsulfatase A-like enzyme